MTAPARTEPRSTHDADVCVVVDDDAAVDLLFASSGIEDEVVAAAESRVPRTGSTWCPCSRSRASRM
jgi:hypothetical protein